MTIRAPLLAVIPFNSEVCVNLLQETTFKLPMYVPVIQNTISQITDIAIYDGAGDLVPFVSDAVTSLRLHFDDFMQKQGESIYYIMDAFKVYLPSNAWPTIFHDNTATDYRTRFDKPTNLNDVWEVGVGSIANSSHINGGKECDQMHLKATALQGVAINILHPYSYYTSADGLWKGIAGVLPDII